MLIIKIISGGQTGADIAGLKFAKDYGISTGGWAPQNYMTENGPMPKLKNLYGLMEHEGNFNDRTIQNVMESDGTLLFINNRSRGSMLTFQTCQKENKPYIINPSIDEFIKWLFDNDIKNLNIAGDRESDSPGIEQEVYNFLLEALFYLE
jgi:Circularly permutated YpsA SLOG family